jgi:hypothetical protein
MSVLDHVEKLRSNVTIDVLHALDPQLPTLTVGLWMPFAVGCVLTFLVLYGLIYALAADAPARVSLAAMLSLFLTVVAAAIALTVV